MGSAPGTRSIARSAWRSEGRGLPELNEEAHADERARLGADPDQRARFTTFPHRRAARGMVEMMENRFADDALGALSMGGAARAASALARERLGCCGPGPAGFGRGKAAVVGVGRAAAAEPPSVPVAAAPALATILAGLEIARYGGVGDTGADGTRTPWAWRAPPGDAGTPSVRRAGTWNRFHVGRRKGHRAQPGNGAMMAPLMYLGLQGWKQAGRPQAGWTRPWALGSFLRPWIQQLGGKSDGFRHAGHGRAHGCDDGGSRIRAADKAGCGHAHIDIRIGIGLIPAACAATERRPQHAAGKGARDG